METLPSARALMGMSLAFHIVYTALAIGLPVMFLIAEGLSLRTGDEMYHRMARAWARTAGVLFAIGAVSGTILSFELGLLWPEFMRFAGAIIGMPFSLEGFAFFVEAIFLALYLYGDERLSRRTLFLTTIPAVLASALSAIFVISANAWMNTPRGFAVVDGQVQNVRPFAAMFNPAMPYEAIHGTLAAYVATGLAVAGVYAVKLLRGSVTHYNMRALTIALAMASAVLPMMFITGDLSARFLAENQKPKFAAMEGLYRTQSGAPLTIGGWPDPATGETRYGLQIPRLLSVLGYGSAGATVTGLNDVPASDRPDPRPVHLFFDLMVGSFGVMALALVGFWWRYWRVRQVAAGRWTLRALVVTAPLGFVALESGWMVTELGRQPWIVTGFLRVSEGVTPRAGISAVFGLFLVIYLALTAGLLWLLLGRAFTERGGAESGRPDGSGKGGRVHA